MNVRKYSIFDIFLLIFMSVVYGKGMIFTNK